MNRQLIARLFAVATALAFDLLVTTAAHATVTTLGYWRMGEADLGAVSGGSSTSTTTAALRRRRRRCGTRTSSSSSSDEEEEEADFSKMQIARCVIL